MPNLDPTAIFKFDQSSGAVRVRGGERALVLTESALAPLVNAAVMGGDLKAIRRLGRLVGSLAAQELPRNPGQCPLGEVTDRMAGLVGLFGFGKLAVEQWGDALVATVAKSPVLDEGQLTLAALLGGALSELSGQEVACVPVGPAGAFLVVHSGIAEAVWGWAREGMSLAAVLGRLVGAA